MRPVKATLLGSAEDSAVQQRGGALQAHRATRAGRRWLRKKSSPKSARAGKRGLTTAHLKGRLEGFREQYNGQL